MLLSNAMTFRRGKSLIYSRVAIIVLIYTFLLALSVLFLKELGKGISLYGGLFHATSTTQIFHIFIILVSATILQLTALQSRIIWNDIKKFYDYLTNLVITLVCSFWIEKAFNKISAAMVICTVEPSNCVIIFSILLFLVLFYWYYIFYLDEGFPSRHPFIHYFLFFFTILLLILIIALLIVYLHHWVFMEVGGGPSGGASGGSGGAGGDPNKPNKPGGNHSELFNKCQKKIQEEDERRRARAAARRALRIRDRRSQNATQARAAQQTAINQRIQASLAWQNEPSEQTRQALIAAQIAEDQQIRATNRALQSFREAEALHNWLHFGDEIRGSNEARKNFDKDNLWK